ncbi:uncharacterized protein LOC124811415 [Hydra vulgaris]|uniref:uncharacterized protein LOC124811415 n=1 Tax=Hydra vulgaris TaxID=6087 RepID=UPI001F5FEDE4|nr:uncharacterized protein LOC124811415 [Hydra vulgaris]
MNSVRYGVSARATAAIATATLIDAGLITSDDKKLIIDHSKVSRAQEKVISDLSKDFDKIAKSGEVKCIFFDGRIVQTKQMIELDDSNAKFPVTVKEEHYSVCMEPGGKYLFHFTPEKATKSVKHAEIIANKIVEWLTERGIDKSLLAVGRDSTNVNTGWEGGVIKHIDIKLGKKLVWLICQLHTNELPLRHLITNLDGQTKSNNKWSGVIGSMLDHATDLDINPVFETIKIGNPLISLDDKIINDLAADQFYGYKVVCAIRSGILPPKFHLLQIGPISHSRWLTTANRICRIWISKHGIQGKDLENLRSITEYIVGVYFPCWFKIKVEHSWIEGSCSNLNFKKKMSLK